MIVLNLGCGINRKRLDGTPFPVGTLHVDHNAEVGADIVADLNEGIPEFYENGNGDSVRLWNNVDEIHAYHLIEHIGQMGDTVVWFRFWRSIWKALKPDGLVYIVAPYYLHESAISDPTHCRLIAAQTFHFLNRKAYTLKANDKGSAMSKLDIDFDLEMGEFKLIRANDADPFPSTIVAVLCARKNADGTLRGSEIKVMEAV